MSLWAFVRLLAGYRERNVFVLDQIHFHQTFRWLYVSLRAHFNLTRRFSGTEQNKTFLYIHVGQHVRSHTGDIIDI